MEKSVKVPYLEEHITVNLEIGTYFYQRMKSLFHYLLKDKESEDIVKLMAEALQLSEEEIKDKENAVEIYHLQTVMIFLRDMEQEFSNKDLIKYKDVEYPKTTD
jgi:hypothetical protein